MWSYSKYLIPALCLLLSACGFEPLYAKKDTHDVSKVFAGVKVDFVDSGHPGQQLRAKLEDSLNPDGALPVNPAYRLTVTFTSSAVPIGVARDGTVSRYNVYSNSHYILYRNSDNKAITSGDVSYVNSYNNLTNEYFSTYVSSEDAVTRNIDQLGELYRQRLTAYLEEGAPEQEIKQATGTIQKAYTPTLFNQLPNTPKINTTY